jgi:NitT/TauT family transport system permease protein
MSAIEPAAHGTSLPASRTEGGAAPRAAGGRLRPALRRSLPPLLVLVGALAGWYAVTYLALTPDRRFLLPPPHEVVRVGLLDPSNLMQLLGGLATTSLVALLGLAIAIVLGIGAAIGMSQAVWLERSFYPWAVVLQTIPILAVVPLIGFWFGFGLESRLIVCVVIALFPIVTNTLFGLKSVERGHRDLFALHGGGRWQQLTKLQLPGALPAIFAGLRISAGLSVIGAIVADFFFRRGQPGLGRLIDQYTARLQSEQLFAAIVASSLLGLLVFSAFGVLGRLATRSWVEEVHDRD